MRSIRHRLEDIRDSITIIEQNTQSMDAENFVMAFERDILLADTVSYRFIVIGEAVRGILDDVDRAKLSTNIIDQHPEIDWKGYAAMRNIISHQYFRRAPDKIWAAIEQELPVLKGAIESALETTGQL